MARMPALDPGASSTALRRTYISEYTIFGTTALSLLMLVLFPWLMRGRTEGLLHPHGYCYLWDSQLVGAHVVGDLLIGLAYVSISITLGYLVYRVRHLLPFHWMFLAFGLFILTCGATHFMEVWILWHADFWASAALKIVTAVASVATAIALPPLVPQVSRLLRDANLSAERETQLRSERRRRDAALAESHAKDMFLATLSHELRTPLNVIAGWVHILHTRGGDAVARQRAVAALQRNIALQKRLVEDMLDVSTILTGRLQLESADVDFATLTKNVVEAWNEPAAAKGVGLTLSLPQDALIVRGDNTRLHQVLANLLSNAVKFTPPGGWIRVALDRTNDEARLTVTDNGEGIDAAFLPRVFDVFSQADQSSTRATGGLGLGLAIVRQLTERHGGTVTAVSPGHGQGTTFVLQLPLAGA